MKMYASFENNKIIKLMRSPFDKCVEVNMADIVDGFDGYQYLISFVETEEYRNMQELYMLRIQRETECFSVINRGSLWYDTLTDEQKEELKIWYKDWLDVTDTKIIPEKPNWLK